MTKIHEQYIDYVIDYKGRSWSWFNGKIICLEGYPVFYACKNLEEGIAILKNNGHIKSDPLKKALKKLNGVKVYNMPKWEVQKILRDLATDLTDGDDDD